MSHEPANDAVRQMRRVLVVDDNRDAATSLALLLNFIGHDTQTAYDGADAIAKAATFKPDAILLDIGLPNLSGYDVCRAIRRSQGPGRPVIIALTGWGQDQDREKTREAGFDAHVLKPPSFDMLMSLLDSLLSGQRNAGQTVSHTSEMF